MQLWINPSVVCRLDAFDFSHPILLRKAVVESAVEASMGNAYIFLSMAWVKITTARLYCPSFHQSPGQRPLRATPATKNATYRVRDGAHMHSHEDTIYMYIYKYLCDASTCCKATCSLGRAGKRNWSEVANLEPSIKYARMLVS